MGYRSLALLASLGVAIFAMTEAFLVGTLPPDGPAAFWYFTLSRCGLLVLVAVPAGLAARRFHWWRDYLGKAWTLLCAEYLLLLVSELAGFAPRGAWIVQAALLLGNLCGIGAFWLLGRALSAAGLGYAGPFARKLAFTVVALAVAVALVHKSLWHEIELLRAGEAQPGNLVSAIADIATFTLVAPLLLTTLTLRGGHLFWVYLLLSIGAVGWMVNQGAGMIAERLGLGEAAVHGGQMTGYAMACCFLAAAGFAQWLSTRRAVPNG
jgi:hypothetical protein